MVDEVRVDLSTRSDVINKGLLRSIKSYFYNKFKKMNHRMVARRFVNVKAREIIPALESFLKAEFQGGTNLVDYN